MWRSQFQRPAGERQAIGDELRSERRQEVIGTRHGAGFVDQLVKSRGQPHARHHAVAAGCCHRRIVTDFLH
jgi:hypothetical protein